MVLQAEFVSGWFCMRLARDIQGYILQWGPNLAVKP